MALKQGFLNEQLVKDVQEHVFTLGQQIIQGEELERFEAVRQTFITNPKNENK